MAAPRRGVHLFVGDVLIGHRWTERATPAAFYEVDGEIFNVTSLEAVREQDGSFGFNVQLEAQRRPGGG